MGKKYLDTKKGTLESSILGVWEDAANVQEMSVDEKYTDAQRAAREKARGSAGRETSPAGRIRSQDRNYAAKTGKYSDKIKGTFRGMDARDDAKRKLELLRKKRQALSKEREKIAASYEPDVELLDVLDEEILFLTDLIIEEDSVDAITRMDGRTKAYRGHRAKLEAARAKREAKKLDPVGQEDDDVDNDGDTDSSDEYLKKRRKAVSKAIKNEDLDEKLISARGKDIAQKMNKSKTMKAFAKKVAQMQTVTPDKLERMLPDYVAGKDIYSMFEEGVEEFAVGEDVPAMEIGTDRYREYLEDLTPGEESDWTKAQNSKVDSMKEAIAKIWGLDEWKNGVKKENRRVNGGDKRRTENKNGGRTLTGKKAAAVEVDPTIKEKKK